MKDEYSSRGQGAEVGPAALAKYLRDIRKGSEDQHLPGKYDGVRYDISANVAAVFFGKETAGLFYDGFHKTPEGFIEIRDAFEGMKGIKHRLEKRPEGLTFVVRGANEGWDVEAHRKNETKRAMIGTLTGYGMDRDAIKAATTHLGEDGFEFCFEIANEGYAHALTPDLVEASVRMAKKKKLPLAVGAAHYTVKAIESGQYQPVFQEMGSRTGNTPVAHVLTDRLTIHQRSLTDLLDSDQVA